MSAPIAIHPAARANRGVTEEIRGILARRLYAVLATQNADGTTHLAPVMFVHEHDKIFLETGSATRKARNIAARPLTSLLVQTPEASWARVDGQAQTLHGPETEPYRQALRCKYLSEDGRLACDRLLDEMDDVVVVIHPTKWLGWDLGIFMAILAQNGIDTSQADAWFLSDE